MNTEVMTLDWMQETVDRYNKMMNHIGNVSPLDVDTDGWYVNLDFKPEGEGSKHYSITLNMFNEYKDGQSSLHMSFGEEDWEEYYDCGDSRDITKEEFRQHISNEDMQIKFVLCAMGLEENE